MQLRIENCGSSRDQILALALRLGPYLERLQRVADDGGYDAAECSINLPGDEMLWQQVQRMQRQTATPGLKYLIDIGIGGSNLGTKAVYDALLGYADLLEPHRFPKMLFVDTNDPETLSRFARFLEQTIERPEEVLINAISKSGSTTETIVNLELIWRTFQHRFPHALDRWVITTDYQSKLWRLAEEKGISALPVPPKVGGRYSVFSAVGLFPLAAAGFDVSSLREGAREACTRCLSADLWQNPAILSAVVLFLQHQQGKIIHDTFLFHPELESCGKWYRQLMGESIGKEKNLDDITVHAGITPTVSIGSTDLHSMAQLTLGGPDDKVTTFVWCESTAIDPIIPQSLAFPGLVGGIAGTSANTVMQAILHGVKAAYRSHRLPFMEMILADLSPKSLAEMFQVQMFQMMCLAQLFHVNAFDQPNVEDYKTETRRFLESEA